MANQRTEKKTKGAAAAPARTPSNLVVFLVGAFGGVAPTLLRFAIDLSQQRSTVAALNSSVLLGIALFGLLGGGVAAIWQEIDLKKVFYIGLGLPSLLTVIASSATAPKAGLAEYRPVNGKVLAFGGGTEPVLLRLAASAGTSRLKVIFPPEVSYTNACFLRLFRRFESHGPGSETPARAELSVDNCGTIVDCVEFERAAVG